MEDTNYLDTSKTSGKTLTKNVLLYLLRALKEGLTTKQILDNLKWSKQRLKWHLDVLEAKGLIEKTQSYPIRNYRLLPIGMIFLDTSKTFSHTTGENDPKLFKEKGHTSKTFSDTLASIGNTTNANKELWDVHNLIVGFRIKNYGNYRLEDVETLVKMMNWKYAREDFKDFIVNIQDTGLLKIYCPRRYGQDTGIVIAQLYKQAQEIADYYARRYCMEISDIELIRPAHKTLLNSSKISGILKNRRIGGLYADASEGTLNLEENQDEDRIEALLKLPEFMAQWIDVNERLSFNIEAHLDAVTNLGSGVNELRGAVSELLNEIRRLNGKA